MAEYIKRTDVIEICEEYSEHCLNSDDAKGKDIAVRILDEVVEMPTADVVEVVFCKDCEHWRKMGFDPIFEKEFGHCHNNDFPFMCETRPDTNADDYCSYGERRTDNDL